MMDLYQWFGKKYNLGTMKKLIFATGNKGKLKEVKKIFSNTDYEIISLYDLGDVPEIIEDGDTYEANALIKAKAIYEELIKSSVYDGVVAESIYNSAVIMDEIDGEMILLN